MLITERRQRLLQAVEDRGAITLAEAARALGVSRMTLHRDLDVLAARGLLEKVRGGAVRAAPPAASGEALAQPFAARYGVHVPQKKRIARHLLRLLSRARTLLLDASSTAYMFAELLPRHPHAGDLFVVTGSLPLFERLRSQGDIHVALHGGEPHPRTGALVGQLALRGIAGQRFDWAVMSALGVLTAERSVFVSNPEEVEIKRAYLRQARKAVLAVDRSKLGLSGAFELGPLHDFEVVVTETGPQPPASLARARKR